MAPENDVKFGSFTEFVGKTVKKALLTGFVQFFDKKQYQPERPTILIKALLNKCYPVKGFVFGKVNFLVNVIAVVVIPRKNSRAICSCCHQIAYDHFERTSV